jgi:hypothetical protein
MARSLRHTPIVPRANIPTEKDEKKLAHQRERKWVHDHLTLQAATVEDFELVKFHEHPRGGREMFAKDGKEFVGHRAKYEDAELMRK